MGGFWLNLSEVMGLILYALYEGLSKPRYFCGGLLWGFIDNSEDGRQGIKWTNTDGLSGYNEVISNY